MIYNVTHKRDRKEVKTKMAVTANLEKVAVKMLLNNGQDSHGNNRTVSVSLGSLNHETYDMSKVMAIVENLVPCFSKTLSTVQEVRTSTLSD